MSIKYEKVVEYRWIHDNSLFSSCLGIKGNHYWKVLFLDWLVALLISLFMPFIMIFLRLDLKREVYWRRKRK